MRNSFSTVFTGTVIFLISMSLIVLAGYGCKRSCESAEAQTKYYTENGYEQVVVEQRDVYSTKTIW